MECPKCGTKIGSMQIHSEVQCERQQRVNEGNRGEGTVCLWCGERPRLGLLVHKNGCPRR